MHFLKSSGFTLVELIVVVTILAILWTIGFVSFLGFQVQARDSARLSDLHVISKWVEYYKLKEWVYPNPSDAIDITFSWSLVWKQWSFWQATQIQTERVNQVPLDPLTKNPYTYATTYNGKEFEVASIYEWAFSNNGFSPLPISQSYAQSTFFTKVIGNYNKKIITLYNSTNILILWVPTLITSEIQNVDIIDLYSNNSFAPSGGKNIPGSYNNTKIWDETLTLIQDTGFVPGTVNGTSIPVLYDGNIADLSSPVGKISFAENLISYYKNSNIAYQYDQIIAQETKPIEIVNDMLIWDVGWLSSKIITLSDPIFSPVSTGIFITYWQAQERFVEQPPDIAFNIETVWSVSIDWGDGNIENHSTWLIGHQYASLGNYEVKISGNLKRFYFYADDTPSWLLEVRDWGEMQWSNMDSMFFGAWNLTSLPLNQPDISDVTNMSFMFEGAYQINPNVSSWDVSNVTNMQNMFSMAEIFNRDLSAWNVANVTNMNGLFYGALNFNGNISTWNTISSTDMGNMFNGASSFNQNIAGWNVTNVTNMENMFLGAVNFNQNIGGWDVANVLNMWGMFWNAENFNQNIGSWDVANVLNMNYMFNSAYNFNQNIGGWDVGNVLNMDSMFAYSSIFNQDLSTWNVINVATYSEFDITGAPPFEFDLEANNWVLPRPTFY